MFETILLRMFEAILKTSLGMIPFLMILLLLENVFRKQYSATWKYSLFSIILIRLLIPIGTGKNENLTLSNMIPKIEVTVTEYGVQSDVAVKQNNPSKTPPLKTETFTIPNVPETPEITMPTISKIPTIQHSFLPPQNNVALITIFAYVWFIVVITKLLYLLIQYLLFYKKVMRWRIAPIQQNTLEIYYEVCKDMEIKKIPELFVCTAITSPMCFGFFRKGIYITKEELSTQQIEMILKHELCHYQRKDLKYQLLCVLVSTIHFFNPFVTAFVKLTERDIELSCDDVVMENCQKQQRQQYSMMLLSMMKESKENVFSNYFTKEGDIVKKRFENILDTSPKKSGQLLLSLFTILFILSATLIEFAEAQQLILLFYLFNLFAFFSFCFLISTKQKNKKLVCTMIVLCLSVNVLLVGCHQNIQQNNQENAEIQYSQKVYSDEEIEMLLKWKTPYVGNNSAVGNLLSVPDGMVGNGFEIQSDAEPYGIDVYYTIEDISKVEPNDGVAHGFGDNELLVNDTIEFQFRKNTMILFSLIGNLEYIDYHVSYQEREVLAFRATKQDMILYDGVVQLSDVALEGYTDSVDSYRYFLEYVDSTKSRSYAGYPQWQKEIDDALQEIVNNKDVALHSDVESYIQNAPNDSYQKIVQKGEQALYYLLKRFDEDTAKGLRGQVMMRACQDILGENIIIPEESYSTAQQWYQQYQSLYHGYYPYYSSIVENNKDNEFLLPRYQKEVLTQIEKKYNHSTVNIFSSLLFYCPPYGISHSYEDSTKVNYYAKIKCYHFKILEQNRGNMLYLTEADILPVKITFLQQNNVTTLEDVIIYSDENAQMFFAEDEQMKPLLSYENEDAYPSVFDRNLEQNLKEYVSKNNIDVQYYCVDDSTLYSF